MIKTARKLTLRTETIRALRSFELRELPGRGGIPTEIAGGCPPPRDANDPVSQGFTQCPTVKAS